MIGAGAVRKLKIFLWIFVIFLVQTVIISRIHVLNATPSLILPYVVCVMMLEPDLVTAYTIGAICSVSAGALCGQNFVLMSLYMFLSSLAVFGLKKRPVYVKNIVKALFGTFIIAGAGETLFFAVRHMNVTVSFLLGGALPGAIISTVFAIIIYPVLKRTMYKEEKKKLLIGDLV